MFGILSGRGNLDKGQTISVTNNDKILCIYKRRALDGREPVENGYEDAVVRPTGCTPIGYHASRISFLLLLGGAVEKVKTGPTPGTL